MILIWYYYGYMRLVKYYLVHWSHSLTSHYLKRKLQKTEKWLSHNFRTPLPKKVFPSFEVYRIFDFLHCIEILTGSNSHVRVPFTLSFFQDFFALISEGLRQFSCLIQIQLRPAKTSINHINLSFVNIS
jgi:hypothetical protein